MGRSKTSAQHVQQNFVRGKKYKDKQKKIQIEDTKFLPKNKLIKIQTSAREVMIDFVSTVNYTELYK